MPIESIIDPVDVDLMQKKIKELEQLCKCPSTFCLSDITNLLAEIRQLRRENEELDVTLARIKDLAQQAYYMLDASNPDNSSASSTIETLIWVDRRSDFHLRYIQTREILGRIATQLDNEGIILKNDPLGQELRRLADKYNLE